MSAGVFKGLVGTHTHTHKHRYRTHTQPKVILNEKKRARKNRSI